jgi:glucose dehydrogenase
MAVKIEHPDAVIVGSGISGALIAKHLAQAGKRVVILEAGNEQPPDINNYMHRFLKAVAKVPESPYPPDLFSDRNQTTLTEPAMVNAGRPTVLTLNPNGGFGAWQDPKQAYLIQKGPHAFGSTYERINGGTARHWLGTSLRQVPNDFLMKTKYNRFVDWPIKYEHLDPWYGLAEHEIGVSANKNQQDYLGITFQPQYEYPMPGIPTSLVDEQVEKAMPEFKIGFGMENIQWKISPTPQARNSQPYQSRRVCAGNTNCIPICPIQAKYDPSVTLAEALRTGNVEIRYKSVVHKVAVGGDGKISGLDYYTYDTDKGPRTGAGHITAKIYIIAGNAIETPRLLLMSKSGNVPKGVANSSGLVGKHLMDHPLYLAWALAPTPVWGYRGPLATSGIEVARDGEFRRERGAFRIEIGNEGWNFAIGDPNTTTADLINGQNVSQLNPGNKALFGPPLVKELNDKLSRQFRLGFLVEQSPEDNCSVGVPANLNRNNSDHLGLPRPEIHYELSDYTKEGIWVAQQTANAIYKAMGAMQFTTTPGADNPTTFEWKGERLKYYGSGHLVGTHTMGTSKSNSVVNHFQKSWDHDNLYIVGAGSFPTVATANPTLTIAALCLRTADHIAANELR